MIISHKHDFFQQGIRIETPRWQFQANFFLRMAFDIIYLYTQVKKVKKGCMVTLSQKNILNQYIFLDDLVSNIFQIKKSVCWRYRI